MADQKDQDPNPPAEDQTLDRKTMAGKSLPGFNRSPESSSDSSSDSSDSSDDEIALEVFGEEFKQKKIEELKQNAYYSLLMAFKAETTTISDKRNLLIQKLMNEWKIPQETFVSVTDKIEKDLLAPQHITCAEKEVQISEEKNFHSPVKKKSLSPTCAPKSGSIWGNVNPESLVGKYVSIRFTDEDTFDEFIIREYDAKQEMHRLENADPNAMEMDYLFSWLDITQIPPEDIMWHDGGKLYFDVLPANQSSARRTLF